MEQLRRYGVLEIGQLWSRGLIPESETFYLASDLAARRAQARETAVLSLRQWVEKGAPIRECGEMIDRIDAIYFAEEARDG